mgnify:CR=1 FL=1
MSDRPRQSTKTLHEILARSQAATVGLWRPVGRSVMSGEIEVLEAKVWMRGTPEEARRNASYLSMLAPSVINSLINEVLHHRRTEKDVAKAVEEAEARVKEAEERAEHARALVAAVTLPTGSKAEALVHALSKELILEAPDQEATINQLKAIALANVQDDDGELSGF